MKTYLFLVSACCLLLVFGCQKDGVKPKGAPVSDGDAAESALIAIDNLWETVLRPQLAVTPQSFDDTVLIEGPGGKVSVNGSFQTTSASSSWSSSSSSLIDVTVTFTGYTDHDLYLDGKLRFFDANSSRTACSSSGCASSSHSDLEYLSEDPNGNALDPVTIAFKDLAGKAYRDKITLSVSKQYVHWQGTLVNSKHDTISVIY